MESVGELARGPRGHRARGLYRRALEIKEQGGAADGISEDERHELAGQIDAAVARAPLGTEAFAFRAHPH